jgi:hypothetical protein
MIIKTASSAIKDFPDGTMPAAKTSPWKISLKPSSKAAFWVRERAVGGIRRELMNMNILAEFWN